MAEKKSGAKEGFQKEGNTTVKNENTVKADTKVVTSTLDQQAKPSFNDDSYQLPPHITLMIGGAILTTIVVSWINNYWQSKRQNKQFEHDSKKHITEIDSEFKKQEVLFQHERKLVNEALLREKRDLLFHSVKNYVNYHISLSTQFTFNITSNVPDENIKKLQDLHEKYDVEKAMIELELYVNNYFVALNEPLEYLKSDAQKIYQEYAKHLSDPNKSQSESIINLLELKEGFKNKSKTLLSEISRMTI